MYFATQNNREGIKVFNLKMYLWSTKRSYYSLRLYSVER